MNLCFSDCLEAAAGHPALLAADHRGGLLRRARHLQEVDRRLQPDGSAGREDHHGEESTRFLNHFFSYLLICMMLSSASLRDFERTDFRVMDDVQEANGGRCRAASSRAADAAIVSFE